METEVRLPVIVDATQRARPGRPRPAITRCAYLAVTCDDPSPGWNLVAAGRPIPFILLGLQGILYQPLHGGAIFQSADDIDDLINAIERQPPPISDGAFTVETGLVWFPTELLDWARSNASPEAPQRPRARRGQVFRVSVEAFRIAWGFRGHWDRKVMYDELRRLADLQGPGVVKFSHRETRAFRDWSERHLQPPSGPPAGPLDVAPRLP